VTDLTETEDFDASALTSDEAEEAPPMEPTGKGGALGDIQAQLKQLDAEDEQEDYESFYAENLADNVNPSVETQLVTFLVDRIQEDKEAQEEADKLYEEGLRRTGLSKDAPGGADFAGASRAVPPIMAELALDCSSRIIKELLCHDHIVKVNVSGKFTPERWKKSKRKEKRLNEQLRDPDYNFEASFESMTTQAPLNGDQYLKWYYDEDLGHPRCEFVPSDQLIVQSTASSFGSASRRTHWQKLNESEYMSRVRSGSYRELQYISFDGSSGTEQTGPEIQTEKISGVQPDFSADEGVREVYECECLLNWEDFGGSAEEIDPEASDTKATPYIVTIDVEAGGLLAVRRNWRKDNPLYRARKHFVQVKFLPWRGPKGIGFIHLIGSLSGALTGTVRALLDSAHIQNSPTGLKLKFAQATSKNYDINIGQINEIEADGSVTDIRQLIMPLPFNGPSPTLVQLMGDLDKLARGVVRTVIEDTAEGNPANMPVGTALSRVEQGLIVYSSIFRRFYKAVAESTEILSELNYLHMDDVVLTEQDDQDDVAVRDDFEDISDITPVADPNTFTTQQRLSQMQAVLQLAAQAPEFYNIQALHRRVLELMKVDGIKELMPDRNDQKDENPVTENVKMSMQQPAFALPDQDHEAHLKVHLDYMMSPLFGMNPIFTAQLIQPMIEHLKQHLTLGYAQLMLAQVNQYLPVPLEELLEDDAQLMEKVSTLLASQSEDALAKANEVMQPYAEKLTQLIQLYQQMMASQPQPMDPVAAQLEISKQTNEANLQAVQVNSQVQLAEQNRKVQADIAKAQTDDKKLQLDAEKIALDKQKAEAEAARAQQELQLGQDLDQAKLQQEANLANQDVEMRSAINEADNQTALQITEMKLEAGESGGNLSTGGGINPGT